MFSLIQNGTLTEKIGNAVQSSITIAKKQLLLSEIFEEDLSNFFVKGKTLLHRSTVSRKTKNNYLLFVVVAAVLFSVN